MSMTVPEQHKAVRWHPPSYDIRVETIDSPKIIHPDDAIVKVSLAALCGSDLHIYRGSEKVKTVHTCGHEFIGQVVELGASFSAPSEGRPALYSSLRVGDKVVSPFTVNCGECHVCRLGYTCRCPHGLLFGCPALEGGQAQYVRVPRAGGTLFNLTNPSTWSSSSFSESERISTIKNISDYSLLLLADILPTGVFAALQVLNHPKILPAISGRPWPLNFVPEASLHGLTGITEEDRILSFAIIGLGPVGVCATVSLLDMLATRNLAAKIVAIDPIESRRKKMEAIYATIGPDGKGSVEFEVRGIEEAKTEFEDDKGAAAVLEVVGNASAMSLAYELVRPFGAITSVGVHGSASLPFNGGQLYDKNVSLDFGRCPARAMFPMAFDLLVKRQDVFGAVGEEASLVDRVVDFSQATEMYRAFDKGEVGKVVFDPWK